jgi:hypothetical protein
VDFIRRLSSRVPALVAAALIWTAPHAFGQALQSHLPRSGQVPGWVSTGPARVFASGQVFDYMDGAGEIPRSYGLVALASEKYRKEGVTIEVVLFDMGSAQDAYGYFSARSFLERSPSFAGCVLDHPARINRKLGLLTFWKDRYTVILQPETGVPNEKTLLQFAAVVGKSIASKGVAPALLRYLPLSRAAQGTVRFVRGKSAFDATLIFSPTDLFGAGRGTMAAAEEVETPGLSEMLAVLEYPSPAAASAALAAYRQYLASRKAAFAPGAPAHGFIATARSEKGTGAMQIGTLLCLVAYAKPPHSATGSADPRAVAAALKLLHASATHAGR